MSTMQKYWRKHARSRPFKNGYHVVPPITCKDGFTMSVQASKFHYCSPRDLLPAGNYAAWEVGFPSEREEALMSYAEQPNTPTETVYGRVPTSVIDALIEKHGGIEAA